MPDFKVTWRRHVYALGIPSQHKIVLLALAEYADWTTHSGAHPGAKRLTADTGCSAKTVQRALAVGVEEGVLVQTARGHNTGRGQSVANAYDLRLPAESQQDTADPLASRPEPTGQLEQANRSIRASQQVTADHPTTPTSTPSTTSRRLRSRSGLGPDSCLSPQALEGSTPDASAPSGPPHSSPQAVSTSRAQAPESVCPLGCGVVLPPAASEGLLRMHLQAFHPGHRA